MKIAYPALFEPQPEGGDTVTFPHLPDAIAEGDTLEEARFNAAECLSLVLDVRVEQGDAIPSPSSSEGMEWIEPGAATQAALLVHLTRDAEQRSLKSLARDLKKSWPDEDQRDSPTLKQLKYAAEILGNRLILSFAQRLPNQASFVSRLFLLLGTEGQPEIKPLMITVTKDQKRRLIYQTNELARALKENLVPFEYEPEAKAKMARETWLAYINRVENRQGNEKRDWEVVQQELDEIESNSLDSCHFLNEQLLRGSIVILFHFFERELRKLLLQHLDQAALYKIYKGNRGSPIPIAETAGFFSGAAPELREALRKSSWLCNVIKHGSGDSLDNIKEKFPDQAFGYKEGEKDADIMEVHCNNELVIRYDRDVLVDVGDFDALLSNLKEFWSSLPEHRS